MRLTTVMAMSVTVVLSLVAVAYGVTRSETARRSGGRAVCGALVNDPQALKAMRGLRDEHLKEMRSWTQQYGADSWSGEARAALQKLREEHWRDMRALLERFGIQASVHGSLCGMVSGGSGARGCVGASGSGNGGDAGGQGSWRGVMGGSGTMMGGAK